ncbi:MAG TPA: hypothetical protein VMS86_04915 [Thermoanaerobaculia bacterium]|nr:hypothetical protein [Thermoanaerobaculia bacterium]
MPGSEDRSGNEPAAGEPALDVSGHSPINIRNLSVRCGHCDQHQTLAAFERRGDWNVYTYECESGICDPRMTRTLVEVPAALDEFANRDPSWRGGKRHAGADHPHG